MSFETEAALILNLIQVLIKESEQRLIKNEFIENKLLSSSGCADLTFIYVELFLLFWR